MSFNGQVGELGNRPSKSYASIKVELKDSSSESVEGLRARLRLRGWTIESDVVEEKDGKVEYSARVSSERGF